MGAGGPQRARLHYIHDTLCGWCYAAAPLVAAARALPGLEVVLHGGGLWAAPQPLDPAMAAHIRAADARIAALTGQVFGPAYLDGLLVDPATRFHSLPPITAICAADEIAPGRGFALLEAIQTAHYRDGRRVIALEVLADLAVDCGLDRAAFTEAFVACDGAAHIAATRALMRDAGISGFPGLLLEKDGGMTRVPVDGFLGAPDRFAAHLASVLA
ncbi:MAG: hypothetical protein B7Z15_10740 [Rhizobiales bacterium 32-66-8]|nr:MAG: hypothetical protein B7Z15_10740 [Rhizobiales bacterium 32-66-8]